MCRLKTRFICEANKRLARGLMSKETDFVTDATGLSLDAGVPPIPSVTTAKGWLRSGPGTQFATVAVMQPNIKIGVLLPDENGWRPVWVAGWMHESLLKVG